jgi:hypothetical protein
MRGVQAAALSEQTPPGIAEALRVVSGFDDALEQGFARVGPAAASALADLAASLGEGPLGTAAREAAAKLGAGSVGAEQLRALAGARAALLGAMHDALLAQVDAALGRVRASWDQPPVGAAVSGPGEAAAAWLQELAISGWRGVTMESVAGADRPIAALLPEPGSRRLAALLDGFAAELRALCPLGASDRIPLMRWADLWMRAMLLCRQGPASDSAGAGNPVSGRLLLLGTDVLEHGTAVQVQIHGILETGGASRSVRTSLTAAKTDTITGPSIWRLLTDFPVLLRALAEKRALELEDAALTPDGHLVWDEAHARLGEPVDPFVTARVASPDAIAAPAAPLDRHPVRINELVLLEGYKTQGAEWLLDGRRLAVEVDRLPSCGPLTPAVLKASTACIGLLHWDRPGGWSLRPLAVQAKSKGAITAFHGGDWAQGPTDPKVVKAESKSGDPVAVLRERAGRLLRR